MYHDPELTGDNHVDDGVTQNDSSDLPGAADLPSLEDVDMDTLPELTEEEKAGLDELGPRLVKKMAEMREHKES